MAALGARHGVVAIWLLAILVFAGHLAYGANRTDLALAFASVWFGALGLLLLTSRWARRAVEALPLRAVGAAFGLVLLVALLQLTPFGPGGPHPIWNYVPSARATVSIDPYQTLIEIVKLLALASAFLVGAAMGADDDRARRFVRAMLLVGAIYAAWAFVDHVVSPTLLFGQPRAFEPDRLSASFGSGNTAATLFGALSLLNLTDLVRTYDAARPPGPFQIEHLQRILPPLARPLVALALSATCLIETLSRAGLAATGGVAIVLVGAMALERSRRGKVSTPLLATVAILGGLILASVALNADLLQRRLVATGAASLMRGQIFAAHWAAFQAAPWSGYGLGSFPRINGMILDAGNLASLEIIGAAHNVYIQWLEEGGLLGAGAMFATVALVGVAILRGAFRRRRMRGWLMAIAGVLALFLLHGASDYALQTPSMALFLSLLLGVGVALATPRPT